MQLPFGPQLMGGPPVGPVPQMDMLPSGFRPPGLMGGGAPQAPQPQGMAMGGVPYIPGLGKGMPTKPGMEPQRTAGDRDMNGYGGSPVDPFSGNPNAQPSEVFNPTGAIKQPGPQGVSIDETGATAPTGSPLAYILKQIRSGPSDTFLSPYGTYA